MLYANFILISDKGRQPLTRRVEVTDLNEFIKNKTNIQERAILRLLKDRHMTVRDLRTYGYNQIKVEFYTKEKII
jgi:hypothetical protein